jgi:3-methyladenine DNA glycosylase AlkD
MKKRDYNMSMITQVNFALRNLVSITSDRAATFFKTDVGDYAEGDQFIGVTVPNVRKIAKQFMLLSYDDLQILLRSKINEERLLALIILTEQYKNADDRTKEIIYQLYIRNIEYVNNWNLVDASAHLIIGSYLWDKDRTLLIQLAMSQVLWERRIAIVSTWYFIRKNDVVWTFKIALLLQNDTHDLIHKAVGWMLREAGKRDQASLVKFLDQHAALMPRTMLRYAIEKFSLAEQKKYRSRMIDLRANEMRNKLSD